MTENEDIIEMNSSWTKEFEPKTIDDMVLTKDIKEYFKNRLKSNTRFHLLLSGAGGIGKTTIVNILAKELNAHILFVKCGKDGTVDYAKTTLTRWCNSLSVDGRPKVVILDELDSASGTNDNSFQKCLRNIITDDVMFFATCNYPEKVIGPLKSRLGHTTLKFEAKDLGRRITHILNSKNISYTKEDLLSFVTNVIKVKYPDIRAIISDLQGCCSNGKLSVSDTVSIKTDNTIISDIVKFVIESKDTLEFRKYYIQSKQKIDDYVSFASQIYNYVINNGIVTDKNTILKMTDMIYQLNVVIDKEVAFFGFLMSIRKS